MRKRNAFTVHKMDIKERMTLESALKKSLLVVGNISAFWDEEKQDYEVPELRHYKKVWELANENKQLPDGMILVNAHALSVQVETIRMYNNGENFSEDIDSALSNIAQLYEPKPEVKELTITWGAHCNKCGHSVAVIYSTVVQNDEYEFMDGDKVMCCQCGHEGEMYASGEDSDITWNEENE